jgi:hypothetical protein
LVKAYQSRLGSLAAWQLGRVAAAQTPRSAGPRIGGSRPRTSCVAVFNLSALRWRPQARGGRAPRPFGACLTSCGHKRLRS